MKYSQEPPKHEIEHLNHPEIDPLHQVWLDRKKTKFFNGIKFMAGTCNTLFVGNSNLVGFVFASHQKFKLYFSYLNWKDSQESLNKQSEGFQLSEIGSLNQPKQQFLQVFLSKLC